MIVCFLVERRNERTFHEACESDGCDGHDRTRFDAVRADTGEVIAEGIAFMGHKFPPGAMWWSNLSERSRPTGPDDWNDPDLMEPSPGVQRMPSVTFADGPHLLVRTPGGVWNIDSRARNCTMPYDYEHRCWIRHGEPPDITVDKNGRTCAAGAGSIQCGDYHGFLESGHLT